MTPERWKQIEDLYQAAVGCGPEERAALLAQASPDVHSTVTEMLAQDSAGNILDRPAWESASELLDSTVAPLAAGTQLGPYKIEEIIGEGGMGVVYRALDSRLGREVAIKILPPEVASEPERLRRFEQEAWAAGTLNHPNILTIYDVGTHDGTSYLVSELLEGGTLRDRLRGGALPRRKALEYAHLIAVGLTAAHERGITHRDLKPENLFLTRDGRLKILDFGLAKFNASATAVAALSQGNSARPVSWGSQPGIILGTVGYMSPEQVQARAVDHRSDLFSLGAILYEMLTGQRAFQGTTAVETLNAILKEEPPLSDDNPKLGFGLTRLLRHCLEKDPRERFQSAKDLAFDLEALGLPQQIVGAVPNRRLRLKAAVAVVSVLALILFLAGREIGHLQPVRPPSFRQITFRSGNITGGRFTPDGQTIAFSAGWEGKPTESFTTRAEGPESRPLGVPSAGVLAISSGGELALMLGCELNWGECRGTIARMPLSGGAPREVIQDSDSADWDAEGNLAVVRPYQGRFRLEYPIGKVLYENGSGWISHLRFSPKGDRIAFLDHPRFGNNDGSVEVVDLSGHKKTLAAGRKGLKGLAWSASGEELWFSGSTTRSPVLSAVTLSGKERIVLQTPGWTEILDIARDGRVLLLRQNPRSNIIYRSPGALNGRSLSWFDWSTAADISSDGSTLLFYEWGEATGGIPIVYVRNTDGAEAARLGEGKALALAPDQKWVLALKAGPPPELILLPTGAGESKVLPHSGIQDYYSAAWFPDGKRILFAGESSDHIPRTFVQDVDGGEARVVTAEGVRATLISPEGRRLAAYGPDGNYYLAPADGGKLQRIRGAEFGDELIQWSEDGRFLYVRGSDDSVVELFRIDLITGRREPWKRLEMPDKVGFIGIETGPGSIRITPDGKSYVYTFWQARGELYIAEGLR